MTTREQTKKVQVGSLTLGGSSPIAVQSMTNTDTRDVAATVRQIRECEEVGCQLIRVAVPDQEAADAIAAIRKEIHIPLVTDIHFDYRLALSCIRNGADKVRINPGNIGCADRVREVVRLAKERKVPLRIGINGGSLEKPLLQKYGGVTAEALVESAMGHVDLLEALDFDDIVISLKTSTVSTTIDAYRLMAEKRPYPLHVGVTEAGTVWSGTIKSAAGIGAILAQGIGDTLRVSLTGSPVEEVRVGKRILQSLDLAEQASFDLISCPTCGRTQIPLIPMACQVEEELLALERQGVLPRGLKVAVMGCAVNGPGEAAEADLGLAGGKGEALLFAKGQIIGKLKGEDLAGQFIEWMKREFLHLPD